MRLGVDVMGGDNAPDEILKGCLQALPKLPQEDRLVLYGDRRVIEETLSERGVSDARIEIVATTEVIGMDDPPVDAIRSKKDASLVVMAKHAGPKAENRLDAIVSAGNTGAMVGAAQMYMRRLPNVIRPGIAVTVPTFAGPVVATGAADLQPRARPSTHRMLTENRNLTSNRRCMVVQTPSSSGWAWGLGVERWTGTTRGPAP